MKQIYYVGNTMDRRAETELIMQNISQLFEKYKIKKLAELVFTKYVKGHIPFNQKPKILNAETLSEKLKLIYWAVAATQLELGYMLLYKESYKQELDNNQLILYGMLFEHHYIQSIECIYRCWERVTQILDYIHTGNEKKEEYYNTIVDIFDKSKKYPAKIIKELKEHVKNWDEIARERNDYSHQNSSLIRNIKFDIFETNIVDHHGKHMTTPDNIEYDPENLFNEIYKNTCT